MSKEVKSWYVTATRVDVLSTSFTIEAEDEDEAYELAEHHAVYGNPSWEVADERGQDGVTIQSLEEN